MVSQFCGTCGAANSGTPFCPGCGTRHDVEANTATVLRSALMVGVAPPPPPPPPAAAFAPASPAYSPPVTPPVPLSAATATAAVPVWPVLAILGAAIVITVLPRFAPLGSLAVAMILELLAYASAAALFSLVFRRHGPPLALTLPVAAGFAIVVVVSLGGDSPAAYTVGYGLLAPLRLYVDQWVHVILFLAGTLFISFLTARLAGRIKPGGAGAVAGGLAAVLVGLGFVIEQAYGSLGGELLCVAGGIIAGILGAAVALAMPASTARAATPTPSAASSAGHAGGPAGDASQRTNTFAILALVFGLLGGLLAIPLGHIARSQIRRTGESGAGMATAGLVLGYVALVLWAALVTFLVIAYNSI